MTACVSVAVMAHRKRRQFVPALTDALDRDAEVVWDRRNDRWDTGARSMLAYRADATHHLVIQDDALVCQDLVAGIEAALDKLPPQAPMCLYIAKTSPYLEPGWRSWPDSVRWLTRRGMTSGVGIVLPVELIEPAVRWGWKRRDIQNYDTRIGRWLDHQGITTWHPWPSLVDHRQSPSLVPHRGSRGRHAARFLGEHESALSINWGEGETRRLVPDAAARRGRRKPRHAHQPNQSPTVNIQRRDRSAGRAR